MKNNEQSIYICLDDSGKLSKNEKLCVYGGIVFFSKNERDKFLTQYNSIIKEIKCKYCHCDKTQCDNQCPEIKCSKILPKHRRRIMNYIKKYFIICIIIKNGDIYDYILNNKSSKGRYLDYAIKILIKNTIRDLIKLGKVNPNNIVKLVLELDEQTTKTNGYYSLNDGIKEELIHGVTNFNYDTIFPPLLKSDLKVHLMYKDSKFSPVIQAADFVAGTVRRISLTNFKNPIKLKESLNFVSSFTILPKEKSLKKAFPNRDGVQNSTLNK